MIKLSIITINYNNAAELERTIQSVVQQSWKAYEYIVIDGGSTDNSQAVIARYKEQLHYWVSEKDKGVFDAMNKGIAVATGTYLLMLNAGDYLYDETVLERVFAKGYTEDLIYGDVMREAGGQILGKSEFPDTLTFNFLRRGALSHQATFIKRSLHELIGLYDDRLRFSSDWKFILLAVCKYNATYRHIHELIAICNSEGLTCTPANFSAMEAELSDTLRQYFPAIIPDYWLQDQIAAAKIDARVKRARLVVKSRIKQLLKKGNKNS